MPAGDKAPGQRAKMPGKAVLSKVFLFLNNFSDNVQNIGNGAGRGISTGKNSSPA
jgi:hypothetical protein